MVKDIQVYDQSSPNQGFFSWFKSLFSDDKKELRKYEYLYTIHDEITIVVDQNCKALYKFSFMLFENGLGHRDYKYVGKSFIELGEYHKDNYYRTVVIPWLHGDTEVLVMYLLNHNLPIPPGKKYLEVLDKVFKVPKKIEDVIVMD